MIEAVCQELAPGHHHFLFLVFDGNKRLQGTFTSLILAHGFDEFLKAQEIVMAFQGKAPLIDTTIEGSAPGTRRTFGNGRFDKRESEMDAHEPINPDDDDDDHEAPVIIGGD